MSVQTNNPKRKILLLTILLIGSSLFLCGAGFFFWLSTGANIDKLPESAQEIVQPFVDAFHDNKDQPNNNSSDQLPADESQPSNSTDITNCAAGLSFDPVLNACVQIGESIEGSVDVLTGTETPSDASQTPTNCALGFVFDPVLQACVSITP